MKTILNRLYGDRKGKQAHERLRAVLDAHAPGPRPIEKKPFASDDTILITYGDTLLRDGERPLETLRRFAQTHLKGTFSGIHILPFFPYSSDDGFSITDFHKVRPDLGDWSDIQAIGDTFDLMVDLVANHVSAQSGWFRAFLADEAPFRDLAIDVDPSTDLSAVTRPRTHPLLSVFTKDSGRKVHLWTTFSADQIDLNYRSLNVLEMMVRTLLMYVSHGARMIRLDAIAYLWKQIGTSCIHLPPTHDTVRLFRRILDVMAPGVTLVTETNVPHAENITYFGNGTDEAQMVYNFTLPPLLLYALSTGRARAFSEWVRTVKTPSRRTAFFNFTASHDGIGVRPLEGILPVAEINWLAERVRHNGGYVSERSNPDGSTGAYELNITYLDALKDPTIPADPHHIPRFLASQAVALALPGVPGIYVHSLLGSPNWREGVRRSGRARSINRSRLMADTVTAQLTDPSSRRSMIFHPYSALIRTRTRQPAFAPDADTRVLDLDDRVFALRRACPQQTLIAVTNFCATPLTLSMPINDAPPAMTDLISGKRFDTETVSLSAYQTRWLSDAPSGGRP